MEDTKRTSPPTHNRTDAHKTHRDFSKMQRA